MTTVTQSTPGASGVATVMRPTGPAPVRLIRAELLKIWTTNSWWIFGILTVAATGLALLINLFQADSELTSARLQQGQPPPEFPPPGGGGPPPEEAERMRQEFLASADVARVLLRSAANVYTSGQFFGLLFMVILGALIVTNEFFHQTATTTFLAIPHRTRVILSKLAAAIMVAFAFWALITAISVGIGSAYFALTDNGVPLTDWPVVRSVLMNLLAFVIWAVLGVGLGVLIRSQLGATLTGSALYMLSFPIAFLFFGLVHQFIIQEDWVWQWIAAVPGVASAIMISPERMTVGPGVLGPPWWVGALVLVGYGIVAGVIGTLITRKRDIS